MKKHVPTIRRSGSAKIVVLLRSQDSRNNPSRDQALLQGCILGCSRLRVLFGPFLVICSLLLSAADTDAGGMRTRASSMASDNSSLLLKGDPCEKTGSGVETLISASSTLHSARVGWSRYL